MTKTAARPPFLFLKGRSQDRINHEVDAPMKIVTRLFIRSALTAAMIAALPGCADQSVISTSKETSGETKTFAAGQIQIHSELADLFYVIDNDVFLCTPVEEPRTPGMVLDAIGSADQTWSVNSVPMSTGVRTVRYPVFADVQTPSGARRVLIPATLKVKIDIKAGETLHSKGQLAFDITTMRSIKAGESLSVLYINAKKNAPAILSVETADGSPSFTAFLRSDNPDGRRTAIDAWKVESERVRKDL
jgi:hypothetical protein